MSSFPPATETALEALSDAHDAYLRAGDFMTSANPRGHIHAYNVMLDAAIDAGFDRRSVQRCSDWAAARLADWRRSHPRADSPSLNKAARLKILRRALGAPDNLVADLRAALVAFRRAGGWPAATTPAGSAAYTRLLGAAAALGYDGYCQLSVDDWAADRLNGFYAREAA